jgi:hypothetical protein
MIVPILFNLNGFRGLGESQCRVKNCKCACHFKNRDSWSTWLFTEHPAWFIAFSILVAMFVIWCVITLADWTYEPLIYTPHKKTLVDVLRGQMEFIRDLLHRIW